MHIGYINLFKEKIKEKSVGDVTLEYITKLSSYLLLRCVEGETDIKYYSTYFNDDERYIGYINCHGKDKLIQIYKYIESKKNINDIYLDNFNRTYFIVDRDYVIDHQKKYRLQNIKKLSITKYPSYENYAFYDSNIVEVLKKCNVDENLYSNILSDIERIFNQIKQFEVLKYMNVNENDNYKNYKRVKGSPAFPKFDGEEEIFYLDKDNRLSLKDEFVNSVASIYNSLTNKCKEDYEYIYNNKILTPLDIKGHDIELILKKILEFYDYEINLLDVLSDREVVSKLEIDFILK